MSVTVGAGTDSGKGLAGERRTFLVPMVPPAAAYVIDREMGELLRAKARALATVHPEVARQLEVAGRQLAEAGRQWWDSQRGTVGTGPDLGVGTSEQPDTAGGGRSGLLLGNGLTVGEVAEMLGVGVRRVSYLIASEQLSATKRKGRWVIDAVSVARLIELRSTR